MRKLKKNIFSVKGTFQPPPKCPNFEIVFEVTIALKKISLNKFYFQINKIFLRSNQQGRNN